MTVTVEIDKRLTPNPRRATTRHACVRIWDRNPATGRGRARTRDEIVSVLDGCERILTWELRRSDEGTSMFDYWDEVSYEHAAGRRGPSYADVMDFNEAPGCWELRFVVRPGSRAMHVSEIASMFDVRARDVHVADLYQYRGRISWLESVVSWFDGVDVDTEGGDTIEYADNYCELKSADESDAMVELLDSMIFDDDDFALVEGAGIEVSRHRSPLLDQISPYSLTRDEAVSALGVSFGEGHYLELNWERGVFEPDLVRARRAMWEDGTDSLTPDFTGVRARSSVVRNPQTGDLGYMVCDQSMHTAAIERTYCYRLRTEKGLVYMLHGNAASLYDRPELPRSASRSAREFYNLVREGCTLPYDVLVAGFAWAFPTLTVEVPEGYRDSYAWAKHWLEASAKAKASTPKARGAMSLISELEGCPAAPLVCWDALGNHAVDFDLNAWSLNASFLDVWDDFRERALKDDSTLMHLLAKRGVSDIPEQINDALVAEFKHKHLLSDCESLVRDPADFVSAETRVKRALAAARADVGDTGTGEEEPAAEDEAQRAYEAEIARLYTMDLKAQCAKRDAEYLAREKADMEREAEAARKKKHVC